jgi:hypothetical protein
VKNKPFSSSFSLRMEILKTFFKNFFPLFELAIPENNDNRSALDRIIELVKYNESLGHTSTQIIGIDNIKIIPRLNELMAEYKINKDYFSIMAFHRKTMTEKMIADEKALGFMGRAIDILPSPFDFFASSSDIKEKKIFELVPYSVYKFITEKKLY